MRSVIVQGNPLSCQVKSLPIPSPGPREVLIRVHFCASNPRDWIAAEQIPGYAINQGVEMAGIVDEIGADVYELRPGDHVAAAHPVQTAGGAYAEFATAPVNTCFLLPPNLTMEEACTIPFSLRTAAIALYCRLRIPFPTAGYSGPIYPPLIIYGASLPVGAFALKLAKMSRFTKIIAICKESTHYVERLEIATHIIKYEEGNIVHKIKEALNGERCYHAVDAVNNGASWEHLTQVMEKNGSGIAISLPRSNYASPNDGSIVEISFLGSFQGCWIPFVGLGSQEDQDLLYHLFRVVSKWLAEGKMSGHPFRMLSSGLRSVETGLKLLKGGRMSCHKITYCILDTTRDAPTRTDTFAEWSGYPIYGDEDDGYW